MRIPNLTPSEGLLGVGDPSATRTVYITVAVLVVLGVAMVVLAIWLLRRTRPELQLFAPLEEMDTRSWRRQDPAGQRRALDASRPAGARPVRREAAEPNVDEEFDASRPVVDFDDLVESGPLMRSGGSTDVDPTSAGGRPSDVDDAALNDAELDDAERDGAAVEAADADGTGDDESGRDGTPTQESDTVVVADDSTTEDLDTLDVRGSDDSTDDESRDDDSAPDAVDLGAIDSDDPGPDGSDVDPDSTDHDAERIDGDDASDEGDEMVGDMIDEVDDDDTADLDVGDEWFERPPEPTS